MRLSLISGIGEPSANVTVVAIESLGHRFCVGRLVAHNVLRVLNGNFKRFAVSVGYDIITDLLKRDPNDSRSGVDGCMLEYESFILAADLDLLVFESDCLGAKLKELRRRRFSLRKLY